MKWILIVITFWRPDVQVSEVRMEFDTEQECLDAQYSLEEKYTPHTKDGMGFAIWCVSEDLEIEYD